ncbi:MAG TPA: hypothetical protein VFT64_11785 [Rickettsiales bacterium]|nr:hypothetical protein [Rickettsiales bacterium]
MRPADAARTAQSYAENFARHGHEKAVPTLIFLDNKPEHMDAAAKAKYEAELEEMRVALQACKNDVYVVMPEDKQRFIQSMKEKLLAARPDCAGKIEEGLLENMLGGSCGGNKNAMLLYTTGSRMVNVDDDMRHYELAGRFNINDYRGPKNELFHGREQSINGEPVYQTLKEFEPYRHQEFETWKKSIADILRKPIFVNTYDVLGAYFSVMQPVKKLPPLPTYKFVNCTDSEPYTNTTDSAPFHNFTHLYPWLDKTKYSESTSPDSQTLVKDYSETDIFDGLKPYTITMEGRKDISEREAGGQLLPDARRVRFVQGFKTGLPDYDAADFLRYATHYPELENPDAMHCAFVASTNDRSGTPMLASEGYSIDGGILGIDNRDTGVGPFIRGLRVDDFAMRLESLKPDCLTAYIPFGQTHLRSPERSNIGKAVCDEDIGTLLKIKLLNARGQHADIDTSVSDEIIAAMLENARDWAAEIAHEIEAARDGGTAARIAMLETMQQELSHAYKGFDPKAFGEYVRQSIQQEADMYLSLSELWPDMREIIKSHPQELPLTNGKTGEKTNLDTIRRQHGRDHNFSMTYHRAPLANFDDDTIRLHLDVSATRDLSFIKSHSVGQAVTLQTQGRAR